MKNIEKLRQRFCKDAGIPIKIFQDPYFEERLKVMDVYFHCTEKYNSFLEFAKPMGVDAYLEEYDRVVNTVIESIKKKEAYKYFNDKENMNRFARKYKIPQRNIFSAENVGKCFLSFDMKKANFTALRHYNTEIVENTESYEDFMKLYTNNRYIIESKYVRQRIFGNVNPKRQGTYESYLMDFVIESALKEFDFDIAQFRSCSSDEVIVEIDEAEFNDDFIEKIERVTDHCKEKNINVRGEVFTLTGLFELNKKGMYETIGFIKRFKYGNKELEIKGADPIVFPYVLRKLYNLPEDESDLFFMHETRTAKLVDPVSVIFKEKKDIEE